LLTRRCDILTPCAVERVDAEVAAKLQCRVIAEGANGPTTPEPTLCPPAETTGFALSPTFSATLAV
jgi:glutamate dehydrogenase/leucine dehydrogenase